MITGVRLGDGLILAGGFPAEPAGVHDDTAQVVWDNIASALVNGPTASVEIVRLIAQTRPDLTVITSRTLSLGCDNFSEFQLKVPGVYLYLGTSSPGKPETQVPIHNGRFQLDEDALPIDARAYAASAIFWLEGKRDSID